MTGFLTQILIKSIEESPTHSVEIDFGGEKRQIISGIKAWYKPEELVGKRVMAGVNLKPAKLAGLLSEGMLLSAEDEDGNLSLMTTAREVKPGAEIR